MSGEGSKVNTGNNMSGKGPKVNTGNIGSINPIKTDGNSGKHADNRRTQVNNRDAQSIQRDNGKQANNYGTQDHPTFTF
uniref:Uncharacterized protein n=1 Tax=Picea sitchensis TaxID=3332 RepID=A9NTX5_PICSI|nr:unknown [Picea sitchensis]ABK24981.1 unknown [Picea sitchensis]ABK25566.1 unknown [Picea sitchensis]ACN39981.1 unknown [Picea sitchensis]